MVGQSINAVGSPEPGNGVLPWKFLSLTKETMNIVLIRWGDGGGETDMVALSVLGGSLGGFQRGVGARFSISLAHPNLVAYHSHLQWELILEQMPDVPIIKAKPLIECYFSAVKLF